MHNFWRNLVFPWLSWPSLRQPQNFIPPPLPLPVLPLYSTRVRAIPDIVSHSFLFWRWGSDLQLFSCDLALALGKDSAFLLLLMQWAAILLILLRQPSEHRNSWIFPTLSKDTWLISWQFVVAHIPKGEPLTASLECHFPCTCGLWTSVL